MSHNGRPTYHSAMGSMTASASAPTFRKSVKDQNSHLVLKFRKFGQASVEEIKAKGSAELNLGGSKSNSNSNSNSNSSINEEAPKLLKSITVGGKPSVTVSIDDEIKKVASKYDDADVSDDSSHRRRPTSAGRDIDDSDSDSDSSSSSDDDDDDEAALMAELEKIKKERAVAQAKKEEEQREQREKEHIDSALRGNPLMPMAVASVDATIKRKWNDDVVFRNQARDEPDVKRRFINDTIRNDFHKLFLKKYMR